MSTNRPHTLRRVASSGASPGHEPSGSQEATRGRTDGDRDSDPDAHQDAEASDSLRARMSQLATLFRTAAEVLDDLAQDAGIQLAGPRNQRDISSVAAATPEPEVDRARNGCPSRLMEVDDVAELLRVTPRTVRRYREEGRLPKALVVGGVVRWRPEDIERWVEESVE